MQGRFYVYELIDTRNKAVFYIGKGQGRRMYDHEREAARGVRSRKCDRIREIAASGGEVGYRVAARFATEADAYEAERMAIERIGLDNLTNVLPGGVIANIAALFAKPKRQPWTIKSVRRLAPVLSRCIKMILACGGVEVAGHDVTGPVLALIRDMQRDCGREQFRAALTGAV